MTIDRHQQAGVEIVRLTGNLDGDEDAKVVEQLTDLLAKPGSRVLLDLGGVPFVNSTGLGNLVRIGAQANVQQSRIILANLTPFVAGVMETTQLNRFFEICGSTEDALARFAHVPPAAR